MTPEMMKEIWDKEGILNYMKYFDLIFHYFHENVPKTFNTFQTFFKRSFSLRDVSFVIRITSKRKNAILS